MRRLFLGLAGIALAAAVPLASASAHGLGSHNPQHNWYDPEVAGNKGHEVQPIYQAEVTTAPSAMILSPQPIPGNENCREYRTSVIVDGRTEPAYGMACRRPDGSWEFVR